MVPESYSHFLQKRLSKSLIAREMPLAGKLVLSKTFEKSYKKFTGKNQSLKSSIAFALNKLELDPYQPSLKTHKLSGKLAAYFACSCGYDCRIVFTIENDLADPNVEIILLLDIGTHDGVY